MRTLLLLPGMDGTGELFERFIAVAPPGFRLTAVRLPQKAAYDELEHSLIDHLPGERFSIVAESFSGPLGIRVAYHAADRVDALVFSNTFADSPRNSLYALLPWALMFRLSPPGWMTRRYLLGRFQNRENFTAVRNAARQISADVMAKRVVAALGVNDVEVLRKLSLPMLYLRGTEDRLVLDQSVKEMQRANPTITRRDISAPHLLLQTAAKEAWTHIQEFIVRIAPHK